MSPIKVDDSVPTISPLQFSTRAIHVGNSPSAETGAVIPPLSLSTTFEQESVGVHSEFYRLAFTRSTLWKISGELTVVAFDGAISEGFEVSSTFFFPSSSSSVPVVLELS